MVVGEQIRAARAVLRWSVAELSERSGVSEPTIKRIEARGGVPDSRGTTLNQLEEALREAGIEFVGTPNDNPGIRWKPRA